MILNESSKIRQIGCIVETNLTGGTAYTVNLLAS